MRMGTWQAHGARQRPRCLPMLEGRSGAGFAACTTIAVIFGQYLTPEGDAVYATLYRFSSIAVAVLVALTVIYLVHKLLNLSPLTRYRVGAVEDS